MWRKLRAGVPDSSFLPPGVSRPVIVRHDPAYVCPHLFACIQKPVWQLFSLLETDKYSRMDAGIEDTAAQGGFLPGPLCTVFFGWTQAIGQFARRYQWSPIKEAASPAPEGKS